MHHCGNKEVDYRSGLDPGEVFRADADNLVNIVAAMEGVPNHFRIAPEAASPIVVRKYRVGVSAGFQIVTFGEQSSRGGPKSKRIEHRPGNVLPVRFFHLRVRSVGQISPFRIRNCDQLGLILHCVTHQTECWIRPAVEDLGSASFADAPTRQSVKLLGLRHRQRAQQQSVDQPEGGGARPNSQAQR